MNITLKLLYLTIASTLAFGCSWVNLSDKAAKVRTLEMHEVKSCKKKGQTLASVKGTVLGVERDEKKMAKELETIARNEAPELNADTVVAVTPIKDGQRTFYLYKCVDPDN